MYGDFGGLKRPAPGVLRRAERVVVGCGVRCGVRGLALSCGKGVSDAYEAGETRTGKEILRPRPLLPQIAASHLH
jgi:hypothetical protein